MKHTTCSVGYPEHPILVLTSELHLPRCGNLSNLRSARILDTSPTTLPPWYPGGGGREEGVGKEEGMRGKGKWERQEIRRGEKENKRITRGWEEITDSNRHGRRASS